MSIAHAYSAISDRTPSKPRSPTPGSTSTWVRIRVAPCEMHFSSVRRARALTSSTVNVCFTSAILRTANASRAVSGAQRSMMQDLSR
jgi:hypothetical protein